MSSRLLALLVTLAVSLNAQAPPPAEQMYAAIRSNDLATVRTLVRDGAVNARDPQGQTPLMWASAYGSEEAVRLLLDAGADVNAASTGGVTALHVGITDAAKTRLLVDAGAEVNAVSQLGRTPLLLAASGHGAPEIVRMLLAKGAKVNIADTTGVTPLIAAAAADNAAAADLLLANGADVRARAGVGAAATALMGAAFNANLPLLRTLLARGADVSAMSGDRGGTVKNGPVRFGYETALHFAVMSGNPEAVRILLQAGAAVDARDVRGMTPLMVALGTDRPAPEILRALVSAGADPASESDFGESAVTWAKKFNDPAGLAALRVQPSHQSVVAASAAAPAAAAALPSPRHAVERSLPVLRKGTNGTMVDGGCVACHAQPLTGIAFSLATARGWTVPTSDDVAQTQVTATANIPTLLELREGGGSPDGQVYGGILLAAVGAAPSRGTDALAYYLAAKQYDNGSWHGTGASRAPMQDGNFSRTAMAIRVLRVYGLPARATEMRQRIARASRWLAAQPPISTEDRVMQLLGLHWADAEPSARQTRLRELRALQRPDGGWAQTTHLESDAYATGQVVFTLRELGVPVDDAAVRRGAEFLLRTQRDDGSWLVKSRAMKIQPYFESGFPYGHDQWISQAGTAWASMALAVAAGPQPVPAGALVRTGN